MNNNLTPKTNEVESKPKSKIKNMAMSQQTVDK